MASAGDIDTECLRRFLVDAGVAGKEDSLEWRMVSGGRSNLTYFLEVGEAHYVLRRPPLGANDDRAQYITREFGILSALSPISPFVPEPIVQCADTSVIGAPFFIMRRIMGRVIEGGRSAPDLLNAEALDQLIDAVVDGLVALHGIDYRAVEQESLGKPEGYTGRQVSRWCKHWRKNQQRPIPALDEVARRLEFAASVLPLDAEAPVIVHGDYNIGNLVISSDKPVRLAGILDWEMTAIGHPLMDLGLLVTYNGPRMGFIFEVDDAIAAQGDFPPPDEIAKRYASRSGRSIALLDFFKSLAFFKVLVLIEDVRSRHLAGLTPGEGYAELGANTLANAEALLSEMNASSIPELVR